MDEREEEAAAEKMDTHQQLLKILELLDRISHDLTPDQDPSAIKTPLELRSASSFILSTYPHQFSLSQHLSDLADSIQNLNNFNLSTHSLKLFLIRRFKLHEITQLVNSIESNLQELIDRENISNLTKLVAEMRCSLIKSFDEEKLFDKMSVLQNRLLRGFNINLQDMLLKSGVFTELEWVLCNPLFSIRVREKAAILMKELVLFNKNVFVGSVLVGGSVKALVLMGSLCSLQVLSSLIKAIRSPLVDEIESCGGILKIVDYLSSSDLEMRITAMNCLLEIGYYGRKRAVETMINCGLVKKLVELQRLEMAESGKNSSFTSCVARFAVQLEVGEGLRQREKRGFKQLILGKVREVCVSDAESATIVAEVLWGSSP